MSPEEMRVRIAEACGWYLRDAELNPKYRWCHPEYVAAHDPRPEMKGRYGLENPPDYLNDLNACHEMEKHLVGRAEIEDYEIALAREVTRDDKDEYWTPHVLPATRRWHANATQRAKAFVVAKKLNLTTPRQ